MPFSTRVVFRSTDELGQEHSRVAAIGEQTTLSHKVRVFIPDVGTEVDDAKVFFFGLAGHLFLPAGTLLTLPNGESSEVLEGYEFTVYFESSNDFLENEFAQVVEYMAALIVRVDLDYLTKIYVELNGELIVIEPE